MNANDRGFPRAGGAKDRRWAAKKLKSGGGESGIRTHGAVISSTHDFQSCSFGQLGHLSADQQHGETPAAISRMRWRPRGFRRLSACIGTHRLPRPALKMAERVGFEPTIPFLTGYRFSRAAPSATRPPLPGHFSSSGKFFLYRFHCSLSIARKSEQGDLSLNRTINRFRAKTGLAALPSSFRFRCGGPAAVPRPLPAPRS